MTDTTNIIQSELHAAAQKADAIDKRIKGNDSIIEDMFGATSETPDRELLRLKDRYIRLSVERDAAKIDLQEALTLRQYFVAGMEENKETLTALHGLIEQAQSEPGMHLLDFLDITVSASRRRYEELDHQQTETVEKYQRYTRRVIRGMNAYLGISEKFAAFLADLKVYMMFRSVKDQIHDLNDLWLASLFQDDQSPTRMTLPCISYLLDTKRNLNRLLEELRALHEKSISPCSK